MDINLKTSENRYQNPERKRRPFYLDRLGKTDLDGSRQAIRRGRYL